MPGDEDDDDGLWHVRVRSRQWWLHTTLDQRQARFWCGFSKHPFTGILNLTTGQINAWRVYFFEGEACEWWTELKSPPSWAA